MSREVASRVKMALYDKFAMIRLSEDPLRLSPGELERRWNDFLSGIGARRVGRLMGMIVGPESGVVRFADPLGDEDSRGFVDMDEETFNKVATLGLP